MNTRHSTNGFSTVRPLSPLRSTGLFAIALMFPVSVLAQSDNGPLTRAQVLQHLSDLEGVGYRPAEASRLRFPYDIESAEARLAEKKRQQSAGTQPLTDVQSNTDTAPPPDGNP